MLSTEHIMRDFPKKNQDSIKLTSSNKRLGERRLVVTNVEYKKVKAIKYATRVLVLILTFAINAQSQTLTRDNPANASVTTYQKHSVLFAVWASGLSGDDEWDYAEWYIDGWLVGTTPMSGQTDYVSWSKVFDTQGVYQISVDAVYTTSSLVGDPRTEKMSWSVSVNSTDPIVTRVDPNYNVTVEEGSWEIFKFQASDPGGDLWRAIWYYDGIQIATDILSGSITTGQRPFTFDTPGQHEIKLVVWDSVNFTDETSWAVTVGQTPIANPGGPYSGTVYQSVEFDGSGSTDPDGTIVSYYWEFGDGSTSTGAKPSHTYTATGNYTVGLLVTDNDGSTNYAETYASIGSIQNRLPNADPGGPYSGHVGQAIQFDGSGSEDEGGTIVSYLWNFGDGTTGTGVKPSHAYAAVGQYTVTLTVTDNDGATHSYATTSSILNTPPLANPGGPYTGYVGEPVLFDGSGSTDSDGSIVSYHWYFDDENIGSGSNPTHSYASEGTYNVSLTVTDNEGASDTEFAVVEISQPANQLPTANPGGPYTCQVGEQVQFDGSDSYDSDGIIISYEWDFGDGNTGTGMNPTHSYNAAGIYTVTLKVTDDDNGSDNVNTSVTCEEDSVEDPEIPWPPRNITISPENPNINESIMITIADIWPYTCVPSYAYLIQDNQILITLNIPPYITCIEQDTVWEHQIIIDPLPEGYYEVVVALYDSYHGDQPLTNVASFGVEEESNQSSCVDEYIDIAAGYYHSLALKADGSIVGWGNNQFGQANAPEGNDYIAIAVGADGYHSLALKSDGSIVGWGDDEYGQASPPVGNDYIAIAAGFRHSLALKSDGSIIAWGRNNFGQIDSPAENDFIAIAAGTAHSIALKSDGSIIAWGRNAFGQSTPPSGNDFVAIAGGGQFSLALKGDGSIVAWGGINTYGQTTPPTGNDFVAISAGRYHALALKSDGRLVSWGDNEFTQTICPAGNDFKGISAGRYHNLALRKDGSIAAWGSDEYGQANPPNENAVISLSAGSYHSLALKANGSIIGWGYDNRGQASPPSGNDFVAIDAGDFYGLALKSDGSIAGWGYNNVGQATPPSGNDYVAIEGGSFHGLALKKDGSIVGWGANWAGQIDTPPGNDFIAIEAGRDHSLALKSDGSIAQWGDDESGQGSPPSGNDFIVISAGSYHNLALKADGSIVQWGDNRSDQGTPPVGNDFVAISGGWYHSLALKSDGSIVAWGNNDYGQTEIPDGNDFIAIAAGSFHNFALRSNGTIVGWGLNEYGQANPPNKNTVALAAGGYHSLALQTDGSIDGWGVNKWGEASPPLSSDFVAIATGGMHSLALKTDGCIVGWGSNDYGQAKPPDGDNFAAISAGWYHSLALKTDGSIIQWGDTGSGQGSPPAGHDFAAISAGSQHNLALKTDGSIVQWGDNTISQGSPPTGNDFIAISAGGFHSLALKSDGSIVGWGSDEFGQNNPPAGNDFIAIAAGGQHSLALKNDGTIDAWGYNNYGQATPPDGNDFIAIAAGNDHCLAFKSDGTFVYWGSNALRQSIPEINLVINPGLESENLYGWRNWDCESMIEKNQVLFGKNSLLVYNRTEIWQGPVQTIRGVENGKTYHVSAAVRLRNKNSDDINLAFRKIDSSGISYYPFAFETARDDQWILLSGDYTLDVTGILNSLSLYVEGPDAGVDFYVDQVQMIEVTSQ